MNKKCGLKWPRAGGENPLVSVVIPTRCRPHLVERAVRSALDQSLREIEVVVVIDGPDPSSEAALLLVPDPRLHVLCLRENVGGSESRNIGVRYSRGRWIALLDDDDEWLPGKLAIQLRTAELVGGSHVFVASRFIERTELADRVLPRRMLEPGELFSDYLFVRRGWNSGETFLQTSTWFISRELLTEQPFAVGLKRCQDLDWLLHATALPKTKVVVAPEVLAIFHHEDHGQRVSRTADWRFLYDWAIGNRALFTAKAFSFFIATFCAPSAAKEKAGWRTLAFLLRRCIVDGSPDLKCLVLFLTCWLIPENLRRSLRTTAKKARTPVVANLPLVVRAALSDKAG